MARSISSSDSGSNVSRHDDGFVLRLLGQAEAGCEGEKKREDSGAQTPL